MLSLSTLERDAAVVNMSRAGPRIPSSRASARVALRAFNPDANLDVRHGTLMPPAPDADIEVMLHNRIYTTRLRVNCLLRWKLYWSRKMFLRSRANMIRPVSGLFSSLAVWKIVDAWRELTRRERDNVIERLRSVCNLSLKRTFLVLVNKSAAEGQRFSPSECSNLLTALLHWYAHKLRPRFRALLAYSVLTKVFLDKVFAWATRLTAFRTMRRWAGRSSISSRPMAIRFYRSMQIRRIFESLKMVRSRARSLCAVCNERLLFSAKKLVLRCMRCWHENLQISRSLCLRATTIGIHACKFWAFLEWKVLTRTLLGYKHMFIRQCRVTAVKYFKRWHSQSRASRIIERNADRAHDLYRFRSLKRALFVWRRLAKCAILAELQQRMSRRQFMLVSFQHFRHRLFAEKALAVVETLAEKRGNAAIHMRTLIQWRRSMMRRQFLRRELVRMNSGHQLALTRAYFVNFKFLLLLKRRAVHNIKVMGPSTIRQWREFLEIRYTRLTEIFRLVRYLLGLKAMHLGLRASRLPLSDLDPRMWPPVGDFLRANAVRQHLGIPKQIHALVCSSNAQLNSSFQQCLRFDLRLNALRVFNTLRSHLHILRQRKRTLQLAVHHSFSKFARKFFSFWQSNCQSRANFRRGCVRLHYILLARYFRRFVGGIKILRLLEVERRSAWLACTYTRITRALHKWNEFTRLAITTHVRTGRLLNKQSLRLMGACMRIWTFFTSRSLQFQSISRILSRIIVRHRLRCAVHSWIEKCRSIKVVAVHMTNLGRYKNLIKSWLGWSSLAVANRSQRFQVSQADMFFRSWAFRRAVFRFKILFRRTRSIGHQLDAMTKRRHKKMLRYIFLLFNYQL